MDESSDDEELITTLMQIKQLRKGRKRKSPFTWVRELYRERQAKGAYNMLIQELRAGDREYYFR